MILVETKLGKKEVTIEQAIALRKIVISATPVGTIKGHPLCMEFLEAYPEAEEQEIKFTPYSQQQRLRYKVPFNPKKYPLIQSVGITPFRRDELKSIGLVCPFCQNESNPEARCGGVDNCELVRKVHEAVNGLHDGNLNLIRLVSSKTRAKFARNPAGLIKPVQYVRQTVDVRTGEADIRYYDAFFMPGPNTSLFHGA